MATTLVFGRTTRPRRPRRRSRDDVGRTERTWRFVYTDSRPTRRGRHGWQASLGVRSAMRLDHPAAEIEQDVDDPTLDLREVLIELGRALANPTALA